MGYDSVKCPFCRGNTTLGEKREKRGDVQDAVKGQWQLVCPTCDVRLQARERGWGALMNGSLTLDAAVLEDVRKRNREDELPFVEEYM